MLSGPPEKMVQLCQPLHPLVFNCLFCLSHPDVHTLSIGAAKSSDFDLQLETLELLERAGELVPPIDQRLRTAMVEAVGADLADGYAEGLPHWEDTRGLVNIAMILKKQRNARNEDTQTFPGPKGVGRGHERWRGGSQGGLDGVKWPVGSGSARTASSDTGARLKIHQREAGTTRRLFGGVM